MGRASKKDFIVTPRVDNPTLYEIKYSCGGQVPTQLLGGWTSRTDANKRIKYYTDAVKRKPSKKSLRAAGE